MFNDKNEYDAWQKSMAGYEPAMFKCGGKSKKACGGLKVKLQKGGKDNSNNVQMTSQRTWNDKKTGDTVTERRWSDGTRSQKRTDSDQEGTTYIGRRGERSTESVVRTPEKADSLRRADWTRTTAPALKKKIRK